MTTGLLGGTVYPASGLSSVQLYGLQNFTQITRLEISGGFISGTIPDVTGVFTGVAGILNMAGNSLSGVIPTTFPTSVLSELYLYDNFLSGSVPTEMFSTAARPTIMHLYGNQFTGVIPNQVGTTTGLVELRLDNNRLNGTIPVGLGLLTNLSILSLQVNQLLGGFPVELSNLPKLTLFALASNSLSGTIPEGFPNAASSINLMLLANNKFSGDLPSTITKNYNLFGTGNRFLDFSLNRLNDLPKAVNTISLSLLGAMIVNFDPQDVNECTLNTSDCFRAHNASCFDGWSPLLSFTCKCSDGYGFNGTDYCVDINECSLNTDNCDVGKCVNTPGSFRCCSGGLQASADGTDCVDVDECATGLSASLISANGTSCGLSKCLNFDGNFSCCPAGYEAFNGECRDTDECSDGSSLTLDSASGPTHCPATSCINHDGNFTCCDAGFEAFDKTCRDIDECSTGASNTQFSANSTKCEQARCVNFDGNFSCCLDGYSNGGINRCTDINECERALSPSQLGLNGTNCSVSMCVNTQGSFFCCASGYEALGGVCTDIDECTRALSPSQNGLNGTNCSVSRCVNTQGSFFCCPTGYEPLAGICHDVDECTRGLSTSQNGMNGTTCAQAQCVNTQGNFFCCASGFESGGGLCRDIDECTRGLSTSQNGMNGTTCDLSLCVNTPGNFFCCGSGYETFGGVCLDVDECARGLSTSQNGMNGTTCVKAQCINTPGNFSCCASGYETVGSVCTDINECTRGLSTSQPGIGGFSCTPDVCVNAPGNFTCCSAGFQANAGATACIDINECTDRLLWNTTNGLNGTKCKTADTCVNTNGSFYCCGRGFRSSGDGCIDINECTEPGNLWNRTDIYGFACASALQCGNTFGNFSCCTTGYRSGATGCFDINECTDPGNVWQTVVSLANGTACNGSTLGIGVEQCMNVDGSFFCCLSGFRGSPAGCVDINECSENRWNNELNSMNGTGCIDGSYCVNQQGGFYCCQRGYTSNGLGCVDINECENGGWTSNTSINGTGCINAAKCVNLVGSFFCCAAGFERDGSATGCQDINECGPGLINAALSVCPDPYQCINTFGNYTCCPDGTASNGTSCVDYDDCKFKKDNCAPGRCVNLIGGTFYCCKDGQYTNATGDGCRDINECIETSLLVSPIICASSDSCVNVDSIVDVNGSYTCCPAGTYNPNRDITGSPCLSCFSNWTLTVLSGGQNFYQSLAPYYPDYPQFAFAHESCSGNCEGGFRLETRNLGRCSEQAEFETIRKANCSYPCKNLTLFNTARTAMGTLRTELSRDGFIYDIYLIIFNTTISLETNKKRQSGQEAIDFIMDPCPDNFTQAVGLLRSLAGEIVPDAPSLTMTSSRASCSASISSSDPVPYDYVPVVVGVVVGVFGLLLLLLLLAYIYTHILRGLPRGVSWSYQAYLTNPIGWTYRGTRKTGYYFKELQKGSHMYNKANALFESFHDPTDKKLIIKGITAVYNPLLVTNFIGQYKILTQRSHSAIFTKQPWTNQEGKEIRQWVYNNYVNFCNRFSWNLKIRVPIVPMLHGTDAGIAEKICETGFASLSSLDAGYFGKGIYFTSYGMYTLPYVASRNNPALILSYTLPGNVYPVIEDHQGPKSLVGAAIKNGYSSHYVSTNGKGSALDHVSNEVYDELVIPQESQITPAFIFLISNQNLRDLAIAWEVANRPVEPEKSVKLIGSSDSDDSSAPIIKTI